MKRVLKWIGIILASLLGVLVIAGFVLYLMGESRLNKTYDFPASNLTLPTDEASLALGKHRVEVLCQGCHGDDLGGIQDWFDAPPIGRIASANLTSGEGGIGREFETEDYVRAVRHGINRQGKPIFMTAVPSTAHLSDEDLAAIIAYLRTVPPVDRQNNGRNFTPVAKVMFGAGLLGKLPAEAVSHEVHVSAPPPGATADFGEYLVNTNDCRICHGADLNGGNFPDPTVKKISPNLTPGGELGFWTEEQFVNTLRTGETPGGHKLDPQFMPWNYYRKFTDEELKAIWLYLQSLPKLSQFSP